MQNMQMNSLTMHDTKYMRRNQTKKNCPRISHIMNVWLINHLSSIQEYPCLYMYAHFLDGRLHFRV